VEEESYVGDDAAAKWSELSSVDLSSDTDSLGASEEKLRSSLKANPCETDSLVLMLSSTVCYENYTYSGPVRQAAFTPDTCSRIQVSGTNNLYPSTCRRIQVLSSVLLADTSGYV